MTLHSSHRIDKKTLDSLYALAIVILLVIISIHSKEETSTFSLLEVPQQPKSVPIFTFAYDATTTEDGIEAKTYLVYDVLDKKVLLSKNEADVVPLASITKLMTAVTAKEVEKDDRLIKVIPEAIDAGYDIGLKKGQLWKVDELIKYMLVFSSNDAANLLAVSLTDRQTFISTMNAIAKREGMTTLTFTNPNGLDSLNEFGGKGSALDVARLMAYAYKSIPTLIDATTKPRATVITNTGPISGVPNTNQMVDTFIGIEGSKTGFTDEAGGNLVMIFDISIGHPIVIVVTGSTRTARFTDVEKLYERTKKALK